MKKIYLAITVDIDPDNSHTWAFGDKKKISWRGVDECLIPLINRTKCLIDDCLQSPKFTWFVRADSELNNIYGCYSYLFEKYKNIWRECEKRGDEIGWHPHISTLQELIDSYHGIKGLHQRLYSVRIGNAFHSNSLMVQLASYKFIVDSTALPGRVKFDKESVFNWAGTPSEPYFPSIYDYRIPGDEHLDILEIPFSMIDIQSSYDKKAVSRYLNLSYRHEIIKNAVCDLAKIKNFLVTILHPSELLEREFVHPLLSFDMNEVVRNLRYIIDQIHKHGRTVEYITMTRLAKLIKEKRIQRCNQKR